LTLVALAGCGTPAAVQTGAVRQAVAQSAREVRLEAPMVFIGGGKDQDDVMRLIMKLAGGQDAPLVIVPLASGTPDKSGQAYVDYMRELGFPNASYVVPGAGSSAADVAKLASAKAVFFSGGDQSKILGAFGPAWQQALKSARAKGCVVAGTSAGAMVWGQGAILGGDPLQTALHGDDPAFGGIRLGKGLGLAPSLVVDTHFSERGRVPRLAYAVATQPGAVGLGVDPATAAIVHPDGRLEVAGRGTVTVLTVPAQPIKAPMTLKDMRVHLLSAGDTLGLNAEPVAR
jgi:cyanophycinase